MDAAFDSAQADVAAATRALEVVLSIPGFEDSPPPTSGQQSPVPKEVIVILHAVLLEDERVLLADVIRRNGQSPLTTPWRVSGLDSQALPDSLAYAIRSGLRMARFLETPDLRPLPGVLDETWDRDGMEFAVAQMIELWPRIVEELSKQ